MNIRLIALLHGILFIGLVGEILLRSTGGSGYRSGVGSRTGLGSRRRSGHSGIAVLGAALMAIGWLGNFFGSWIKAAVSRQREFLADASAVQFTRNPTGIGEALKIIGGYSPAALLSASHASEMSHLFFGQAVAGLRGMFATHPPLSDRIGRIEPGWDGHYILRQAKVSEANTTDNQAAGKKVDPLNITAATVVAAASIDQPTREQSTPSPEENVPLDTSWQQRLHDPFSAIAVLFALLLSDDEATLKKQCEHIKLCETPGLTLETLNLLPALSALDEARRLPMIQLALPALKCLSEPQYKRFNRAMLLLIRADQRYELFEWCLYQVVRHYLDPEFGKTRTSRPRYQQVIEVADAYRVVLSLLTHYGGSDNDKLTQVFHRGANAAGLYNIELLGKAECTMEQFISATQKLADCYPLLKPRLLKGLSQAASQDGNISVVEQEIITAIAAVMDSPIPRAN